MIISASRRTDIPAFYSEWFYKRLEEGYLYVRNPMNPKQVSEIRLNRDTADCFVFWTKNPSPMMDRLSILDSMGYPYYFQFTLNSYGADVEPGLPDKGELVSTFKTLSRRIGPERVIWRYDPILLGAGYSVEYHCQWFEQLCGYLCGYTRTCVISFLDMYVKIKKNMERLGVVTADNEKIRLLAASLAATASRYGICLQTCSEAVDLMKYGIKKGKCIDDDLIAKITGRELNVHKDRTQREVCGCVSSVDIGTYHTCSHLCRYCYANLNPLTVQENRRQHHADSPLMIGRLMGDEKITLREMKTVFRTDFYEQIEFRDLN